LEPPAGGEQICDLPVRHWRRPKQRCRRGRTESHPQATQAGPRSGMGRAGVLRTDRSISMPAAPAGSRSHQSGLSSMTLIGFAPGSQSSGRHASSPWKCCPRCHTDRSAFRVNWVLSGGRLPEPSVRGRGWRCKGGWSSETICSCQRRRVAAAIGPDGRSEGIRAEMSSWPRNLEGSLASGQHSATFAHDGAPIEAAVPIGTEDSRSQPTNGGPAIRNLVPPSRYRPADCPLADRLSAAMR
jgi:hypothetical protein